MGFLGKLKSGIVKIGSFAQDKALPFIGKVAGVVRKVGEFAQGDIGKTVLNAAGMIPVIGSGAKALQIALPSITTGAGLVERGAQLGQNVLRDVKSGDSSNFGQHVSDAKNLFADGSAFRKG